MTTGNWSPSRAFQWAWWRIWTWTLCGSTQLVHSLLIIWF
jgi:hypothetical protein